MSAKKERQTEREPLEKPRESKVATQTKREKEIPEYKIATVKDLANDIKKNRTMLIASTKGLPSRQFQEIKKNFRGKAIIKVVRKSAIDRAIDNVKNAELESLKNDIKADSALFFSNLEPFELSGLLADNQSPTKAKAGDIAPDDINVEPGPTNLVPGPAISELSGVGIKVAVEGGKLAIKLPVTVVRKGDAIKPNVASVLAKLDIKPMKVGFEPLAAFDAQEGKVYRGIKIDKAKAYEELKESIGRALGFAIARVYAAKETISFIIGKAGREEIALSKIVDAKSQAPAAQEGTASQPSQENAQLNATEVK